MPIPNSTDTITYETSNPNITTLKDAVIIHIKLTFEMNGIDAAMKELNAMAAAFSFARDWPSIFNEATAFLLEKKRLAEQAEKERKEQRDAAVLEAIAQHGVNGQFNFLSGRESQAPYYSSSTGGHNNE